MIHPLAVPRSVPPQRDQLSRSARTIDAAPAEPETDHETPQRSEVLRWRLSYAKKGIRTSPADVARKKPHLKGWQDRATTSPQQITAEGNRWPDAGILTPTGSAHRLVVIDEDDPGELARLEEHLGVRLRGVSTEVLTPSGGRHVHLLLPEGVEVPGSVGKNLEGDGFPGVDVRGEGNLALLPPSAGYSFANRLPKTEAPREFVEWARSRKKTKKTHTEAGRERSEAPFVVGDGPIPSGTRHDALASILGHAHDGQLSLADLTALAHEVNASRCVPPIGSPGDDPIGDVDRIAASIHAKPPCRPVRNVDPEVEELLTACSDHWYAQRLPKGGKSKLRDTYRGCLMGGAKRGEARTIVVDGKEVRGVAFSESTRQLAEAVRTSNVSAWKNINRLIDMGALAAVEKPAGMAWTFVLIPPAAPSARKANTPRQPPASVEKRGVVGGVNPVRADALVTPFYGWRSPVGNSGGGVEAAVEAFGPQTADELVERLGISRARDLERRQLARLEEMGVLERDGGGRWTLPADHAVAVGRRLEEPYTTVSRRRRRKTTDEGRAVVWVEETATEASELERDAARAACHAAERAEFVRMRQRKLARIAAECFGVASLDPETGEIVSERREVSEDSDRAVPDLPKPEDARHHEAAEFTEAVEIEEKLRAQPGADEEQLSELAVAIRDRLELYPGESRQPAGWMAGTLWAYDLVEGKPTAQDVQEALAELRIEPGKEAA